jgi:hypothetical protein
MVFCHSYVNLPEGASQPFLVNTRITRHDPHVAEEIHIGHVWLVKLRFVLVNSRFVHIKFQVQCRNSMEFYPKWRFPTWWGVAPNHLSHGRPWNSIATHGGLGIPNDLRTPQRMFARSKLACRTCRRTSAWCFGPWGRPKLVPGPGKGWSPLNVRKDRSTSPSLHDETSIHELQSWGILCSEKLKYFCHGEGIMLHMYTTMNPNSHDLWLAIKVLHMFVQCGAPKIGV